MSKEQDLIEIKELLEKIFNALEPLETIAHALSIICDRGLVVLNRD